MKIEIPKPRQDDIDAQAIAFGELTYRIADKALSAGYHPGAIATALARGAAEVSDQHGQNSVPRLRACFDSLPMNLRKANRSGPIFIEVSIMINQWYNRTVDYVPVTISATATVLVTEHPSRSSALRRDEGKHRVKRADICLYGSEA